MGTQWIGPDLRGPGGRQVFHQIHPGKPDADEVVREMQRLHVVFVRMDQDAQSGIPGRLARAISVWRNSILAHVKAALNMPGRPKEEQQRLSRLLADMISERAAYASLGFVAVLPVLFSGSSVYPLPGAVPPSRVVGHQVASLICVARGGGKITKDEALAREVASRIASGKIPLPPLTRVLEEELPILIGETDLGVPVIFHLGSATQASHIAILGPTGRGKTVLAKRIVRQARERGVTPIILDTKGEMYEGGRGFLGLPVFSPTSREAMWPAWSFPAAHRLWREIIARADRRNGEIRIARESVARAVDASRDELMLSSQMLGQLVEFASTGWVSLNTSEFAFSLIGALKEKLDWLRSLKAPSHEEAIFSMSRHIALIGAMILHRQLGQEAVPLLGENAPYRHLFFGSQEPSPLLRHGGIVTFQTLVGSVGNELLKEFYTYVLQIIVSAIVAMRHAGTAPPRVLLYTEEAHRVGSDILEQMARTTRAFGISVMLVTQSHTELSKELLEQLRGLVVMGPSRELLGSLFERLAVPYPVDPFIRAGIHGNGVFLGRSKAVIDFPVPVTVKLSPEEKLVILGTRPPEEAI
jgi:hypothetical protein